MHSSAHIALSVSDVLSCYSEQIWVINYLDKLFAQFIRFVYSFVGLISWEQIYVWLIPAIGRQYLCYKPCGKAFDMSTHEAVYIVLKLALKYSIINPHSLDFIYSVRSAR